MSAEIDEGRTDMLVDGHGPEEHRGISVAEEFNANYLQIYYGNFPMVGVIFGFHLAFLL